MTARNPASIDLNHHKGLVVSDEITGAPFGVEGSVTDGSINVNVTGGGTEIATIVGIGPVGQFQVPYDAITYTATSGTVDTYTYKSGGTGGTTTATVTITYTDSGHGTLVSVVRT